jgi:FecR protein/Putative zinc-finger
MFERNGSVALESRAQSTRSAFAVFEGLFMSTAYRLSFGKHIAALSSAYCHEELSAPETRRVAEHLIGCTDCRSEFEQVKLGERFGRQLELVAAPDSIWTGIATQLDEPQRSSQHLFLKPLAIAAALALMLGGGLYWWQTQTATPGSTGWQVARVAGSPRIGSNSMGDQGNLGLGQWLETDGNSRARLDVSSIGQVEIDPNTRVRLIETKTTEHRLELERGRLSARISAPPKLFFVNTPSAVAEDLGCAYTLEVDDDGNSLLRVTAGWVALQLPDRESKVPAGAACATRRGVGLGTPYFEDASAEFRTALSTIDFDSAQKQLTALPTLIKEARSRDALTLWYLISRVDAAQRAPLYDRLAEFVAPPEGVTRQGVLSLDPGMLNRWRDLIEGGGSPAPKTLTRIWTRALGRVRGWEGKR